MYDYKKLRKLIKKSKLTCEELAELLDISVPALVRKKNGKSPWKIEECKKMKEALNYEGTIEELFEL